MWRKIEQAANDPHKSVPYAPYLMYIVEQVVGRSFHHNGTSPTQCVIWAPEVLVVVLFLLPLVVRPLVLPPTVLTVVALLLLLLAPLRSVVGVVAVSSSMLLGSFRRPSVTRLRRMIVV
jgi:hypothetical protein